MRGRRAAPPRFGVTRSPWSAAPNRRDRLRSWAGPSPRPHPQLERPAERDVRVEAQRRLVLDEPQAREAPRELLERELGLELAQRRPDAEVDALAEREVTLGVGPRRVEAVG